MVSVSSACSSIGDDSTGICVINWLICFNSNGNWASSNSGFELSVVVRRDLVDLSSTNLSINFLVVAFLINANVGIGSFSLEMVSDGVAQSYAHLTTVATLVSVIDITIDKLLLGEGKKFSSSDEMGTFEGTNS